MITYISGHAKAFVAALIAGLTSVQVALDGSGPVTKEQWITLGIGAVIGLLGVAAVPNANPPAPPAPPVAAPVAAPTTTEAPAAPPAV